MNGTNWGFSNVVHAHLTKGKHTITLSFEHSNENMNVDINQAMPGFLRVIRLNNE